jgi:hypothetical protein
MSQIHTDNKDEDKLLLELVREPIIKPIDRTVRMHRELPMPEVMEDHASQVQPITLSGGQLSYA